MQPAYTDLNWAYQLHYYLGFRTHRRRAFFAEPVCADTLTSIVTEICARHDYHLLESKPYADYFRCLLSLRPEHDLSSVIGKIKANAARECGLQLSAYKLAAPIWARGFLARSVGRVQVSTVKKYIERQAEHHGYTQRHNPPVWRYRTAQTPVLTAAHTCFDLNYHVVVSTRYRVGVFDSQHGQILGEYWLKVAEKHGFAIDRMTIVPDHAHLMLRSAPKFSPAECVKTLMNNAEYFLTKRYPAILVNAGIPQLWQPSAYVGTCGENQTALVKAWLRPS